MGFRNLHAFNLALLAKKVWKLLTKSHSLLTRVLKAKYFLEMDILHILPKPGTSYVWRSMLVGLRLLRHGIRRQVGTGLSIQAWKNPWLPKPYSFKPLPYNQCLTENLRVAHCISHVPRQGNLQVLQYYFWPQDVDTILGIKELENTHARISRFGTLQKQGILWYLQFIKLLWRFQKDLKTFKPHNLKGRAWFLGKVLWNLSVSPELKIFMEVV